jgi:phage gpG-like protein
MPVVIEFELEGVGKFTKRINKISKVCSDLTPAWKKIGEDFRRTEEKVFKGQGSYGSRSAWKPLTPKYSEWKSLYFPSKPILEATGSLKNSLITKGANNIEIISPLSIKLGTNDSKFKYHQKGTKKMAARPPITFTKYQGNKWAKIIRDELLKGVNK